MEDKEEERCKMESQRERDREWEQSGWWKEGLKGEEAS